MLFLRLTGVYLLATGFEEQRPLVSIWKEINHKE